jgi:hypothetical protein
MNNLNAPALYLDDVVLNPEIHIIVCTGSGGVGKTTTAAAIALRAAEHGRKVCVLTIDPARRLAQALGIEELDNTPRKVEGIQGNGTLDAMMLDMKRTFDEVVEGHSDPERAQQILNNPFYQSLSSVRTSYLHLITCCFNISNHLVAQFLNSWRFFTAQTALFYDFGEKKENINFIN